MIVSLLARCSSKHYFWHFSIIFLLSILKWKHRLCFIAILSIQYCTLYGYISVMLCYAYLCNGMRLRSINRCILRAASSSIHYFFCSFLCRCQRRCCCCRCWCVRLLRRCLVSLIMAPSSTAKCLCVSMCVCWVEMRKMTIGRLTLILSRNSNRSSNV